jgi:hypothetical protein
MLGGNVFYPSTDAVVRGQNDGVPLGGTHSETCAYTADRYLKPKGPCSYSRSTLWFIRGMRGSSSSPVAPKNLWTNPQVKPVT